MERKTRTVDADSVSAFQSTLRESAAIRRNTNPFLTARYGSGDLYLPVASIEKRLSVGVTVPRAQSQADGTNAFASRTIRFPRHMAMAT
jgi:hypothetical protein